MDEAKIKEIVAGAVAGEFQKQQAQPVSCGLGIDKDKHEKDHQFIDSLLGITERLDKIKWGFLGALLKGAGLFAVGILCLGIISWLKIEVTK